MAVVQGLTEFLPVSSSGHLIALEALAGNTNSTFSGLSDLTIALHGGTLLAVVLVYRQVITGLIEKERELLLPLVAGTIPALIAGGLVATLGGENVLQHPGLAGAMLVVTGIVLWFGEPAQQEQKVEAGTEKARISLSQATWVGIAQAFAIVPGLSRSGLTIVAARRLGLSGKQSAQFSFLLSIPVIAGAVIVLLAGKMTDISDSGAVSPAAVSVWSGPWYLLLIGAAISAVVGFYALKSVLLLLEKGRFRWFTFWCIPLGVVLLVYSMNR